MLIRGGCIVKVVTGAAGQVGTVLVKKLVEQGHDVKAIVTPTVDLSSIKDFDISIVEGDFRDLPFLIHEFQ